MRVRVVPDASASARGMADLDSVRVGSRDRHERTQALHPALPSPATPASKATFRLFTFRSS